jgi:hypothetical protein
VVLLRVGGNDNVANTGLTFQPVDAWEAPWSVGSQ